MHSFCSTFLPSSNFTLNYCLVRDVDTGGFVPITQKLYWARNWLPQSIPIYTPFSQPDISSGEGMIDDLLTFFWDRSLKSKDV